MATTPRLDSYDIAILKELQRNGRMTKVALAEAVNLSPSPCWERLKKLEGAGFITGYRAQVDIRKIAPVTEVLVEVILDGHRILFCPHARSGALSPQPSPNPIPNPNAIPSLARTPTAAVTPAPPLTPIPAPNPNQASSHPRG